MPMQLQIISNDSHTYITPLYLVVVVLPADWQLHHMYLTVVAQLKR